MCTSIFLSNKMEKNLEAGGFIFRIKTERYLEEPFVRVEISDTDGRINHSFAADPETLLEFAYAVEIAARNCESTSEEVPPDLKDRSSAWAKLVK